MSKLCSADEAVNHINSNQRVFVHGGAATPTVLLDALVREASRLRDVELYGRTLNERAQLLISIAHPDDQEALERAWCKERA